MHIQIPRTPAGVLALAAAATLCAGSVNARSVVIDFERFPGPDGTLGTPDDIPISPQTGWSGGNVGLTSEFATLGVHFTPDPPSLNQNVVLTLEGFSDQTNLLGSFVNPVRGVFPVPVSSVSVDFVSANGPSFPDRLEALCADGSTISFIDVIGGHAALAPGEPIYGFRATWPNGPVPQQAAIDNLTFTVIPAPPALVVMLIAGAVRSRR